MWRSDPSCSTIVFSNSGNVAMCSPDSRPWPASHLLDGLPDDFLDRRQAFHDLAQATAAQRDHSFVDGLSPQLQTRGTDQDQLAQLLGDFQHLVQADAAFV